uniref:Uncharacterized protein n=1 Tax=Fagus sylvatica TaxID=28930 RepID=A0A2N9GV38_FAGSY
MVSHIGREKEIGEDDAASESIAMSSVKVGDSREAASCAGVGHEGEQGRERGGWGWLGRSWAREKESRGRGGWGWLKVAGQELGEREREQRKGAEA